MVRAPYEWMRLLFAMKYRWLISAAFVLFSVSFTMAQSRADKYVSDEVLIKMDSSSAARHSVDSLLSQGVKVVERFADLGWQRVKIPAGMSVDEAVARYQKLDGVVAVQPNYYYH